MGPGMGTTVGLDVEFEAKETDSFTWSQSGQSGSAVACTTAADMATAHAANDRPHISLSWK